MKTTQTTTGHPPSFDGLRSRASARKVSAALRTGRDVADSAFDEFLPPDLRLHSESHWTPLSVISRVARWLDDLEVRSVIDIGSGSGKFCVAGALASRCSFTGIEQRPRLVSAARALSRVFAVEHRVRFIEGALGEREMPVADAYYLYNPFGENLRGPADHLDEDVEIGRERYERDLARAEDLLRRAPVGTLLLTYFGFGGEIPSSFEEIYPERYSLRLLRLWRKVSSRPRREATGRVLPRTPAR